MSKYFIALESVAIATSKEDELIAVLEEHQSIDKISKENDIIITTLKEDMSSSEMNVYLFKKGITLSHLVKRKPTLEQQFLDLTKNN